MAVPAGAYQTYQGISNKEDLEDAFYMISPTETPFLTMAERVKATATLHEWTTDALTAASATNAAIEGDDAANGTSTPGVRYGNYTQIGTKFAIVTDTQEVVQSAGKINKMAHQVSKRMAELKRDMEASLTQNNKSSAGGAGTARQLGSAESWIWTSGSTTVGNKTSLGTGTAQTTPSYASGVVAGPTDSTVTGAFVVAALKSVIAACWAAGGSPGIVLVGATQKQVVSGFAGIATLYREAASTAKGTMIVGAADLYVSDFGEHRIVPDRFMRTRVALVLDMDYWSVAYLRSISQKPIARTGAAEKRFIDVEYTLVARNPLSSGAIVDLT